MYRTGCHLAWSFFGSLNALLLYGQEKSKRGMDEGLHHTTIRDRPPPHTMDAVISMSCLHQTRDMFYS